MRITFIFLPENPPAAIYPVFNAPNASVKADYDSEFVDALEKRCKTENIPAGTLGERDPSLDHATVVPLLFLKDYLDKFEVVRVGLSGLSIEDHYRLGEAISETADQLGKRVVMIASGDLSHQTHRERSLRFQR